MGYLDNTGLAYFWGKIKDALNLKQDKLVSGTNIKTINSTTVLGSGNFALITASAAGNTAYLKRPTQIKNPVGDITIDQKVNSLRANRLAFLPADQIIIEKTTDGGTTWVDAGISDATKTGLFSETRASVSLPLIDGIRNVNCGLRITFTAMKYNVPANTPETQKYNYWNSNYVSARERYNQLKEMYFWVSTSNDGMYLKAERATGANSTTWTKLYESAAPFALTGWSGNDYISFAQAQFGGGTTQTGQPWNYRLTFFTRDSTGGTNLATSSNTQQQSVMEIRGYGDSWWVAGNEYAANDKIYTHDYLKNVTFPNKVTASGGFSGNLTGTASGNLTSNSTLNPAKLSGVGTGTTKFLREDGSWQTPAYPSATSTSPKMDGTANVGSETTWAKGDHIHPTDTSRQAKITASGILKGNGSGTVSAATAGTDYQAPLVSGTNIKTINNESLLGSGNIDISSGGSDILWVTLTFNNFTYSADVTYADIFAAIVDGKYVVVRTSGTGTNWSYFPLWNHPQTSGDQLYFVSISTNGVVQYFHVTSSDYWQFNSLDLAPLDSPALYGTPTAPTQAAGNNSTRLATTAFVQGEKNVFIANYGTTTYAEVNAAVTANKAVFAASTTYDQIIPLVTNDGTYWIFSGMAGNTRYSYLLSSSDTWSSSNSALVPTSRTINGKALTGSITLTAADIDVGKALDSKTSISSLANLKTQLTTWFDNCSNNSSNVYYITCSGTWSPFASGLGVIVRLERGTSSGQAFFTGRSDANTPCAAMMANNSGTWSGFTNISTGGGSSAPTTTTATLAVASWSSKSITVTVSGVTSSNLVIVSPAPASATTWSNCGVICTTQATNSLTFTCETTPTSALTANVAIFG